VSDADDLAGQVRESRTFHGSAEVSSTITDEWTHTTATSGGLTAQYVEPAAVHTRTDRSSGTPRTTTVTTTYDADTGAATQVDDEGDDAARHRRPADQHGDDERQGLPDHHHVRPRQEPGTVRGGPEHQTH
jgi:hypothetical protein